MRDTRPTRRVTALATAALVLLATLVGGTSAAHAAPDEPDAAPAPLVVEAESVAGKAGTAGVLDLTQTGGVDWVHPTGTGTDRKQGVDLVQVENLGPQNPITTFTDSPYSYRWSDGDPTPSTTGVTSGAVYNAGTATGTIRDDAGYRVTVPAADTTRRVILVGGVWQAETTISVSDIDATAPLFESQLSASGTAEVRRYTITLRPGHGAVLTSRISEVRSSGGNVSLAAVAVSQITLESDQVSASSTRVPATMDLTQEGPLGWLHMSGTTVENSRGGTALSVANRNPDRAIAPQNDNPVMYRWSDGTVVPSQVGTRQGGVFLASSDDFTTPSGFDLGVTPDARPRTLQFVTGVWQSSARLSVTLDGETTPAWTSDELATGGTALTRLFTVDLPAGRGATVSAQLTSRSHGHGNVTLGAATLSEQSGSRDGIRDLLVTIADSDFTAASDPVLTQLSREVAASQALLEDPSADEGEAGIQLVMLEAAHRAAKNSVADAQYTFTSDPGLVSSFGWEGDRHAPIAYIDGSYLLRDRDKLMVTFGVPEIPGKISWRNAEGYLPAFISSFSKRGLDVTIQSFSDDATVDGNRFEIAYSRMTTTNTTESELPLPSVSPSLVPLNEAAAEAGTIAPGQTVERDYAIAADRFNGTYAWPSDTQVADLGSYDQHYEHMRDYWNQRLEGIADITSLPDPQLVNAYKAGYIYTLIIRDDIDGKMQLHVGENGYDTVYDHDTIGIVATLLTIGDFTHAQDYLHTLPAQLQYDDAKWKYSWPFALYLQRTGDTDFIRSEFENIRTQTHKIETDRIDGGTGIMKKTNAIDSAGYWTIDNWSALTGLATYRYLAQAIGEDAEAQWAAEEYADLNRVVTERLQQTITENGLDYIPISMVQANEDGPRSDPRDANWASMFLFGRWAWDGYLFGAEQSGLMLDWIDQTYTAGFERRADVSDTIHNFGGYPHGFFSSAYNAGYGSAALRGEEYRDSGIRAYQFMIDHAQSGPFGWWEGIAYPNESSPWDIDHASGGGGSNQHMWGQSTATKVLFDSLIAQKSDGTVILGRGLPQEWIASGQQVALENYPVQKGGRVGYSLTSNGTELTLDLVGDTDAVDVFSLELVGMKDNIASVSVPDAVVDNSAGTVRVPGSLTQVVITLRHEVGATGEALSAGVDGTAKVGQSLTATVTPGWEPVAHQWLRNGEPIEGARGATLQLSAADTGAMISVQVSATQTGWSQATVTSDQVGPVASDAPTPSDPDDGQETDPGNPGHQTPGGQAGGSPTSGRPSTDLADTGARGIAALVLAAAALACAGVALGARRRSRS